MAKFYYPPAPGNGAGTFSDNLVGFQITDGSSLATLGNFTITDSSREKITFDYATGGFSEPITLELLAAGNEDLIELFSNNAFLIKFNRDTDDISKLVQYGSLSERLRVATQEIINFFPAALYIDGISQLTGGTGNTTQLISYDIINKQTTITFSRFNLSNPFGIEFTSNGLLGIESSMDMDYVVVDEDDTISTVTQQASLGKISPLRNFSLNYFKYALSFSGSGNTEYRVTDYTPIDENTTNLTLIVSGAPFGTTPTPSKTPFYLKPQKFYSQKSMDDLDNVEKFILSQKSTPQYTSTFKVMSETEGGQNYIKKISYTWPKADLVNLDITSQNYIDYVQNLVDVGKLLDENKTNLVSRFLTTGALKEFDTSDRKVEKTLQIYGRSFDDVKRFIDGIEYMSNITYDGLENVPNKLLRNFALMLGWKTPSIVTHESLLTTLLDTAQPQFSGESIGLTPAELDIEVYRRILMNTAYLFKSKGTRKVVEFILDFIGAPVSMIQFNEYIMLADAPIHMGIYPAMDWQIEDGCPDRCCKDNFYQDRWVPDIPPYIIHTPFTDPDTGLSYRCECPPKYHEIQCPGFTVNNFDGYFGSISGGVVNYPTYIYDWVTGNYSLGPNETFTHSFVRGDYPIDREGYPTKPNYNSSYYFQRGSGWYEETLEHRGDVIIDLENSTFTGCSPTVKTKLNQFSWGGFFGNVPHGVTSNDPGAPYLERFRRFPYLHFGFGLDPKIDDKKSWVETVKYTNLIGRLDLGIPVWRDRETASAQAQEAGCKGVHTHELNGEVGYVACNSHAMTQLNAGVLNLFASIPGEEIERDYNLENYRYADYYSRDERLVINVKNTDIFLNPSQAFIYEVWNQSVLSGCPFDGTPLNGSRYGWNNTLVNYPNIGQNDSTLTLLNAKDFSFKKFINEFISTFINVKNRLTIDDGKTGGYPTLQMLFLDYIKQKCGENNEYRYNKLFDYANALGTTWIKILEQFIPATTLWQGGVRVENSLFHRDKFVYNWQAMYSATTQASAITDSRSGETTSPCCWVETTGYTNTSHPASFKLAFPGSFIPTGATSNYPACTVPESGITLSARSQYESEWVTCKSTYPSLYNYLGLDPDELTNVPSTGVITAINLTTNGFNSNASPVQPSNMPAPPIGGYNIQPLFYASQIVVEPAKLLEDENALPPWGYQFKL